MLHNMLSSLFCFALYEHPLYERNWFVNLLFHITILAAATFEFVIHKTKMTSLLCSPHPSTIVIIFIPVRWFSNGICTLWHI